ncbi:hypothetical protein [Komagataeibacter sp. FNDCF1]|uniref:hypothetical protein n=1 Tax=Komagataeibacter sp. FNDCF1 TaxID=2878681 RepID=UPI001E4CC81E|nr:hypothetical protein [Komagataeibacter sp. FNDCF1]MCE2563678.1 hypothetical protein [Komagataeibacter sp. FNDCF1]
MSNALVHARYQQDMWNGRAYPVTIRLTQPEKKTYNLAARSVSSPMGMILVISHTDAPMESMTDYTAHEALPEIKPERKAAVTADGRHMLPL